MSSETVVKCTICQEPHDPRSQSVCYRSLDHAWECADEYACLVRRTRLIWVMQAALDRVWADLERQGWRLPGSEVTRHG